VTGHAEPATLAELARGRMRAKIPQLERALAGRFASHERFMVAQQLAPIDYLDEVIERVSAEVAERVAPFEPDIERQDERHVSRRAVPPAKGACGRNKAAVAVGHTILVIAWPVTLAGYACAKLVSQSVGGACSEVADAPRRGSPCESPSEIGPIAKTIVRDGRHGARQRMQRRTGTGAILLSQRTRVYDPW
jgi:hypothetical protein